MDDKEENYPDPERFPKRSHFQQLSTDNVSTYDVENPNRTDERRNLLLACMPRNIPGRRKRMPHRNKRKKYFIDYSG